MFFTTDENGNKTRRKWIFVKNNIFFCSVCVCFGTDGDDILSSTGYNYNQLKSETCQILKKHEILPSHKRLMRIHLHQ